MMSWKKTTFPLYPQEAKAAVAAVVVIADGGVLEYFLTM